MCVRTNSFSGLRDRLHSRMLPETLTLLTAFSQIRANKANAGDTIKEREHMAAIARAVLGVGMGDIEG